MSKSSKKAVRPAAKKASVVKKKSEKKATPVAKKKAAVKKAVTKKAAPAKKVTAKPAAKKTTATKATKVTAVKKATPAKKVAAKPAAKTVVTKTPAPKAAPVTTPKKVPLLTTHKKAEVSMIESNQEKVRYSSEELKEFEEIIREKLDTARKELQYIKELLSRKNDEGTDNTTGNLKMLEDGADVLEKESNSAMAARLQKFILQLENAMARIKNGTYGICIVTGKLIPKERLRLVPHTQHSIEAKNQRL